jgi:uracil-DNA glycosylase
VTRREELQALHRALDACRACPNVVGPVVHGPAVCSRIFLVGQAPGPHEGDIGRPFGWTAGKTLFRWFHSTLGVDEEEFRRKVYMAAVLRCFPGKSKSGGDRRPAPDEIERCRSFLAREVALLQPRLILPVGTLAIEQVLGHAGPLSEIIGVQRRVCYQSVKADVICLPHPSGASPWHKLEPGKTLLKESLALIAAHPETRRAFGSKSRRRRGSFRRALTSSSTPAAD